MSDQLQNRLFDYETPPPERVWEKIASSLNEEFSPTLSKKLYEYEVVPPGDIWKRIEINLASKAPAEAKVVPFYTRYRRPLKYSGAVAIFVFLAVLTSLLISKKTESELPQQNVESSLKKEGFKSNSQKDGPARKNDTGRSMASANTPIIKQPDSKTSVTMAEEYLPNRAKGNEIGSSSLPPDKYMMYSDGDGNAIRLPKKIFAAYACPINDLVCKQHLQELREKFAASAMTADFNGLLQILKSLQENQ